MVGETALRSRGMSRDVAALVASMTLEEKAAFTAGADLWTLVANARVDGRPIPEWELLSYYVLLIVAGNETTRNATSGGLLALIENPAELEKLRRNPNLVPSAIRYYASRRWRVLYSGARADRYAGHPLEVLVVGDRDGRCREKPGVGAQLHRRHGVVGDEGRGEFRSDRECGQRADRSGHHE